MASLKTKLHNTSSTNKSSIASSKNDMFVNGITFMIFGLLIFFSPRIIMFISPGIIASVGWLFTSIIMPLADLSGLTALLTTVGSFLYNIASTLIVYIFSNLPTALILIFSAIGGFFAFKNSNVHVSLNSDHLSIDRHKRIEKKLSDLQFSVKKDFKDFKDFKDIRSRT